MVFGSASAVHKRFLEWERAGFLESLWKAGLVDRMREAGAKRRHPNRKARRRVVEGRHRWFNRFRKLLVRYEKLARSFVALDHLAAAIMAFRRAPHAINVI